MITGASRSALTFVLGASAADAPEADFLEAGFLFSDVLGSCAFSSGVPDDSEGRGVVAAMCAGSPERMASVTKILLKSWGRHSSGSPVTVI